MFQFQIPFPKTDLAPTDDEPLILDGFAGGGGASTGFELALGRSPNHAINHDTIALDLHEARRTDVMYTKPRKLLK